MVTIAVHAVFVLSALCKVALLLLPRNVTHPGSQTGRATDWATRPVKSCWLRECLGVLEGLESSRLEKNLGVNIQHLSSEGAVHLFISS